MAGFAVAGIDAPDAAGVGGRRILMPAGDEVDRDHVRHEVDVRMRGGGRFQRLLHRHAGRSEEHTSELQSLMRISYAVFCLKKKNITNDIIHRLSAIKHST